MPSTPVRGDSGAPSRAPEHSGAPAHSTRRSLVRAAVWSAPVVAVALAAPAAAASGNESVPTPSPVAPTTSTLVFDTWQSNAHWDGVGNRTGIDSRVQLQNVYWHGSQVGAPVPELSVSVRYPASAKTGAPPIALSGSGWRFVVATARPDRSVDYSFIWSGEPLGPSRSTPQLTYTVDAVVPGRVVLSGSASAMNAATVQAPGWGDTVY